MTMLSWLLLAVAAAVVPLGQPVTERVHQLAGRGRLAAPRTHAGTGRARRATPPVVPAGLVGALAGACAAVAAGPVIGLAGGIIAATATQLATAAVRRRAVERADAQLVAALALLAAELEAGSSPAAALRGAAEVTASHADRLRAAAAAADEGTDVAGPLGAEPDLRRLGQAWSVAAATGAPLADVLSRLSADLAARARRRRAVAVALAGPRSSAAMLAVLPLLGIGLGAAMGARPLGFLLDDPLGRLVCLAGVVLDVVGVLWTRRLAAAAERS